MEVTEIAEIYKWDYHVFGRSFPERYSEVSKNDLYGVVFNPDRCEPVSLAFLADRRLTSPSVLHLEPGDPLEESYLYHVWTKTQFAGVETHQVIIHILRYLSKKYFSEFQLKDDGKYWETNDEKYLKEQFEMYDSLISTFQDHLENIPVKPGENTDDYVARIVEYINKRILRKGS